MRHVAHNNKACQTVCLTGMSHCSLSLTHTQLSLSHTHTALSLTHTHTRHVSQACLTVLSLSHTHSSLSHTHTHEACLTGMSHSSLSLSHTQLSLSHTHTRGMSHRHVSQLQRHQSSECHCGLFDWVCRSWVTLRLAWARESYHEWVVCWVCFIASESYLK